MAAKGLHDLASTSQASSLTKPASFSDLHTELPTEVHTEFRWDFNGSPT